MDLIEQIKNVAQGAYKLKKKYVEEDMSITYVCLFAQTTSEYKRLVRKAKELGKVVDANQGLIFKFNEPLEFQGSRIEYLRIRRPDTEAKGKGYGDFEVDDYDVFRDKYLKKYPKNIIEEEKDDIMMLELSEDSSDYLVYFPDSPLAY